MTLKKCIVCYKSVTRDSKYCGNLCGVKDAYSLDRIRKALERRGRVIH